MTGGKGVESVNCQDYMLKKMTFQSLVSLAMLPGDNFLKKCQIANLALGITQIGENQVCGDIQKACIREKPVIFGKGSAGLLRQLELIYDDLAAEHVRFLPGNRGPAVTLQIRFRMRCPACVKAWWQDEVGIVVTGQAFFFLIPIWSWESYLSYLLENLQDIFVGFLSSQAGFPGRVPSPAQGGFWIEIAG